MKNIVSRRKALTSGLVASSGFLWSKSFGSSTKNILGTNFVKGGYGSLVKHGQCLNDNYMVWSLMTCNSPEMVNESILKMRSNHKYRSIVKYSSNDKFKQKLCQELLEYVIKLDAVNFQLIRFKDYEKLTSGLTSRELQQRIINALKKFGKLEVEAINAKLENGYGPSTDFNDSLQGTMGFQMDPQPIYNDQLIQLNDLVSGVIYSISKPKHTANSKLKMSLNEHFSKLTGIRNGEVRDGKLTSNMILQTVEF